MDFVLHAFYFEDISRICLILVLSKMLLYIETLSYSFSSRICDIFKSAIFYFFIAFIYVHMS